MVMEITPTETDWQMLLAENLIAREQIRRIIAERLLAETQEAITKMNGQKDDKVPAEEPVENQG
jgi:hypothetical protein